MTTLVKIKEVHLYVGFTETVADCYAAKKLLDDKGIKYTLLAYHDDTQHKGVFESLNTWNWGKVSELHKREFKNFPILHWKEYYDDYEQVVQCADGLEEIKNSDLIKYAHLIV